MSDINVNGYCGKFEYVSFDDLVPESDFARFLVLFIKTLLKSFNLDNEIFPSAKDNKKGYAMHKMACLVVYAYSRGFTKASIISDMAKNYNFFKFVANGIEPDEDTINNFINKWGSFFDYLLVYTVQFAKICDFTNFGNISVDSTFIKSPNNKFNVIHKNDAETLLRYYLGHRVLDKELKLLRYPAFRFLIREDLSNLQKINHLKAILYQFKEKDVNTIPINDIESIHMPNKSGIMDVGYSVQTAVDNASKMFVGILLTDKATDHYQFPDIIENAMENMGEMPETTCVDAGYNTRRVLEYIEEIGLNVLMDNNRSAKLRNGHKSDNKFHKDNMYYDIEGDFFVCYNKEELTYQKTKIKWDTKKEDFVIERIYSNEDACEKCKYCDECCSTDYRIVKISGGILALNMDLKMRDYENILKYITRFSTVEAPNGTLKVFYHINEFLSSGKVNIQNRLNICASSYNLIRIYNQLMKLNNINKENILNFTKSYCESTNAIMPIWRNNTLPFSDKILSLPYICESTIEKKYKINVKNTLDYHLKTLIEANI